METHSFHAAGNRLAPAGFAADGASDFCRTCALSSVCAMVGYGKPELSPLHGLMEHLGPYRAGETVFRQGDPFEAVFAVRAGTVKTRQLGNHGREHVLGFFLPGEVIGLDAIYPDRFPCDAVALEDAQFCRFSFPAMSALATRQPAVQRHLFRLISRQLGTARLLAGDHSADERMAAFLVDLGERYAARGFPGTHFQLSMSRSDIANHLSLAAETVSRTLSRFRTKGLIVIKGRVLHLREPLQLRELGQNLLAA
ncbi:MULTISPECIES: cyclic nucleotide-binding domain-containing protein [Pseudomonadota]|uniref:cyclic nucleotide-binding domain-containing protein n=1 Tax=Pseudomonadota TaxID=1224 RepID=UPI0025D69EDE|nr:cyclic nucleotide-binding domain-containing protein [Paraburkholderia sp.]